MQSTSRMLADEDVDAPRTVWRYKLPQSGGNFHVWAHGVRPSYWCQDIMRGGKGVGA